jgi:hypothetical protein
MELKNWRQLGRYVIHMYVPSIGYLKKNNKQHSLKSILAAPRFSILVMAATTGTRTTTTATATPWVEKYRPKSLSDVSHQTEIISTLTNAVETNRLPHLLFYGPPGVSGREIQNDARARGGEPRS